ncbi:hypothetical protein [Brevibacillus nitrificans]|uniref:hypothetical protein n=1 Tax=Brevibacillus nitrificans TaxID=651560 RepID=UPI0028658E08|nr:hypothetical protein [Brevibacillus nitrificans]MDR7314903.1 uncharacterized protein (UPF0128 family) [Brevibacillus nitrificans]
MSNLTGLILDIDIEDRNPNYPLCINISYEELKNEDIRKVTSKLKYFHKTEKEKLQNRIVLRFFGYPKEEGNRYAIMQLHLDSKKIELD